ncbi:MAG: ABC transporter permease [Rhodospirillaceae bacterium]
MFRNYLAASLRNLVRNRLYAAINIVGLAIGFGAALMIALFVRDEFSYDKWIPGHERLYRVSAHAVLANHTYPFDFAPLGAAALLKDEFPEIEAITRFASDDGAFSLRHNDIESLETIHWADPNLFDVLPLRAVAGNLATALEDPESIVITRALARKYFGRDAPIGETLEVNRKFPVHVTAVLEDLPSNTHLALGFILSGRSAQAPVHFRDISKPNSAAYTYLRLAPGASAAHLREGLPAFNQRHPEFHQSTYPQFLDQLTPIADIHLLPPGRVGEMKPAGSAATAYSALSIAILIVVIAGINFVNLTTARAVRRAVEVGVRKVSGAVRRHLIAQFLGESIFYAALGMALAAAAARLLLPSFNGFLRRAIVFDVDRDPLLLGVMFAVVVAVGGLAGAYPAFVLSRFSPAAVLKGGVTRLLKAGQGRQVLVALQFAILIVLALVSTAVHRQATYAMNEGLRFDKDQMLLIDGAPCNTALLTEVRALPGVRAAVCSGRSILNKGFPADAIGPDGTKAGLLEFTVDAGYFELYGLKPLAGRFFAQGFGSDTAPPDPAAGAPAAVVINQATSRALGFSTPQDAVGKTVRWTSRALHYITNLTEGSSQIIGVAPDIGISREAPVPQIYWVYPAGLQVMNVKLAGNQVPETLAAIDRLWKQVGPPRPITRIFLDQSVQDLYRDVTRLNQMMEVFAAVAVFVACLGLFGLAAFAAESRTKEIGVRKALGASRADILRLMLWEFSKPVLWASLIAWPLAYYIMKRWLEGFADRVDMGLWTFPAASALTLAIAMLTVAGHALLVARTRPVTALRYE